MGFFALFHFHVRIYILSLLSAIRFIYLTCQFKKVKVLCQWLCVRSIVSDTLIDYELSRNETSINRSIDFIVFLSRWSLPLQIWKVLYVNFCTEKCVVWQQRVEWFARRQSVVHTLPLCACAGVRKTKRNRNRTEKNIHNLNTIDWRKRCKSNEMKKIISHNFNYNNQDDNRLLCVIRQSQQH